MIDSLNAYTYRLGAVHWLFFCSRPIKAIMVMDDFGDLVAIDHGAELTISTMPFRADI